MSSTNDQLYTSTPLLFSSHLSESLGCNVYLKLENLQPAHSFKQRGLSNFIRHCREKHGPTVHCVIASGGNAGLAAADAARRLNIKCTVFVPEGVSQSTSDLLTRLGAKLEVYGRFYAETLEQAKIAAAKDPNAVIVPAYEDPLVWEGHATMISEIANVLPNPPDAIFCSVGGGGLLGGIMAGCASVGWHKVPLIALETHGMNCFYQSIGLNPGKWNESMDVPDDITIHEDPELSTKYAYMHKLNSLASSLGASSPSPQIVKNALDWQGGITCVSVPDELSMRAAISFANEHKMNVELACSTTLVPGYYPNVFRRILPNAKNVVFVVCGGFKISLEELSKYNARVSEIQERKETMEILCNGECWSISI